MRQAQPQPPRGRLRRRDERAVPRAPGRPDRLHHRPGRPPAPGAAGRAGPRRAPAAGRRPADQRAEPAGDGVPDPLRGPEGGRPEPAGVLPARAAEDDPEGAGRDRVRQQGRGRAAGEDRPGGDARGRRRTGPQGAGAPAPDALRRARGGRHPHLHRVAGGPPLVRAHRGQPGHQRRGGRPGRAPLRAGQGQGAHPGVHGGAQALAQDAHPHPVLRRAARGGQDLPGALHRRRAGAQVRARLPRAACATRPRSGATGAPTWGPSPGGSSRPCARPAPSTPSLCWTRWTSWGWTSGATPPRPSWRCSTPSRTCTSPTTTWRCPTTSPRSSSSPPPTSSTPSRPPCATAWR